MPDIRIPLDQYVRQVYPEGTIEWMPRHLIRATVSPKTQNQRLKATRRRAAGKPSYRQRQRSARAAKEKRLVVAVS